MYMKNLLEETESVLGEYGLSSKDVLWVGSKDLYSDWENFAEVANVKYDAGYGSAEVIEDLVIVGKDWWLERHEYDGSEWWEFKRLPIRPDNKEIIKRVIIKNYASSLRELNSKELEG